MKNKFSRINVCLKLFRNGLSIFLGILFLGLMSCSSPTDSTSSNPTKDKIPPTVTISTNKSLEKDKTGTITFIFSEKVNGFTKNDVKFSSDDFSVNSVNDITITNFITNNPKEYSLDITPKTNGSLEVSIRANSFEDLSGNKNTNSFSSSFWIRENIPPTVIINSDTLIEGTSAYLSFIFSEKVTNFTPDDIQFLPNEANGVNAEKGNFVTNSQKSYSLEITPETDGNLYVSIQANSFEDLSGNQNNKPYSSNFTVLDSSTATHTISFKLNGGSFISSQITNLKVVTNKAIEETRLGRILSYPPTGPKPSIQAVTRDIFEWRTTNGTKYELSTPVSSDLTLEAVWSNSCGKVETFHPANRTQLKNYVDAAYLAYSTTNLNHIDTSAITDMSYLFEGKKSFNGKIGCWNTANVNNMNGMFKNFESASAFNQDIGSWNVANVTDMRGMFAGASAFNQNIGSWNVANVTNMREMFQGAYAFNGDIGSWDVGNVTTMWAMFAEATVFNQDISSWDVGNVKNMEGMLGAQAFNQDISGWDVGNVTTMKNMFGEAWAFNQDISSWDVGNVTNMSYMFNNASKFNKDIRNWDVGNVTDMNNMFRYASNFNQDIGSWNVGNVNNMSNMFYAATTFDQDLSKWSVSKVSKHDDMFTYSAMESKTAKHPRFLDETPPTVTISTDKSLEIDKTGTITFTFSEEVNGFTKDDIKFSSGDFSVNSVNDIVISNFITNNPKEYSLDITPKAAGTLTISIPANSFEDLSGNQNTGSFSNSFSVEDKIPPTVTISTNKFLKKDKTGTITFTFSEEVNGFTRGDIQLLINGTNGVSADKGSFVANSQKSYSLEITPKLAGTLTISIPANSFEDLSGNQNTNSFSTNFSVVEDKTLPTVNIYSDTLIEGNPAYLSFIFSEKVNNFTPDDIQILTNEANGVNAEKGSFVTNSQKSYSLEITPETNGTLYVSIPANSFYDLYGNQNDMPYSSNFTVLDSSTTTHTISFKLNGGSFISSQITTIRVVDNTAIEETQLGGILSYPPTGPKPSQAVTRDIFEWRNNNGTKYDFSTPVSSDLTLEAVWSNSCGKVETFHPANRNALKTYINAAVADSTTNLNHIDTSAIADMNDLFNNKTSFNGKIGCWNTANVNNMYNVFKNARVFNQDIGSWNVANVNNMGYMFYNASNFNQNISSWSVSNATDMRFMFYNAKAFNQDIGSWNVANVNDMNNMFNSAYVFNQDISSWNVANVTDMNNMFYNASNFNQNIGSWSVSNVTDMNNMFNSAYVFNQDISSWNVANVTDMNRMFIEARVFNQDISSWNVANVTDMSYMFFNAKAFNQNLISWSVSNVTTYDNIFTGSAMADETNKYPSFQ